MIDLYIKNLIIKFDMRSPHQETIQRLHQKLENFNSPEEEDTSNTFNNKHKEVLEKLRVFKNKN